MGAAPPGANTTKSVLRNKLDRIIAEVFRMIMCRQVAKALTHYHYYELPWYRKIPMFIHIRLCVMCGKYHQQVIDMQRGVHDYLEHEERDDIKPEVHLSEEARQRIKEALIKES